MKKRLINDYEFNSINSSQKKQKIVHSKTVANFHTVISGLRLFPGLLNTKDQNCLVEMIQRVGWFSNDLNDQAMIFGNEFPHEIKKTVDKCLNSVGGVKGLFDSTSFVEQRLNFTNTMTTTSTTSNELFDQLIANIYRPSPNQPHIIPGIKPHIDLAGFHDGIVGISLVESCCMSFQNLFSSTEKPINIILNPGDVYSFCGQARWNWTHGIEPTNRKSQFDKQEKFRISLTLRKLLPHS